MADKKDWIYVRVLEKGNFIFPRRPFWFGWVEFVPLDHLDEGLAAAISHSIAAHGISGVEQSTQKHVAVRTIVLASMSADVEREALARFREAIDIFTSRLTPLPPKFDLLRAGAVIDIVGDTSSPLLPPWEGFPFTSALLDDRSVHPSYVLNLLLAAPNGFGQLGVAYARSQHWKMLANDAATTAEKVLLHWMAMEALCSTSVGADPIPNLMCVAGFPIGKRSPIAAPIARSVRNHVLWRKRVFQLLLAARKTRNGIVHEGHRDVDIRPILGPAAETDTLLFLRLALRCLHEHAELVMARGSAPLADLWEPEVIDPSRLARSASWIVDHLEGRFAD